MSTPRSHRKHAAERASDPSVRLRAELFTSMMDALYKT
jgi:hypothetical protein